MTRSVVPAVFYKDPMAALDWLQKAFGMELSFLVTDSEGAVGHAELSWRGDAISVGGEWASEELIGPARMRSPASVDGISTQTIRLYLDDGIDAHCERARAAGARIVQAPGDQFYGERVYRALDPEGHVWSFSQSVAAVTVEEMEKASGLTIRTKADA